MISALLLTTLIWGVGLAAYVLFLRAVPAHRFRRAYLLVLTGVGLASPWLPGPRAPGGSLPGPPQLDRVWLEEVVVSGGEFSGLGLTAHPLTIGYVLGLVLAVAYIAWAIWRLVRCFGESRHVEAATDVGMRVRETGMDMGPFSFGRTLFVSDWAAIPVGERAALLRHEWTHYRLGHRYDNLAMTALCTVAYFHPLAHWLRREIRLVHEYQADREALATTTVREYRRQLLAQTFHTHPSLVVAAFAQRPLQSRFDMMTRRFSTRQTWRLFAAVACVTMAAVACTKESVSDEQLVELETVQKEGMTKAELFIRGLRGGEIIGVDTVEVFDSETGETTVQYINRYDLADGESRTFSGETHGDETAYTQVVRNQKVHKIVEEMPHFAGVGCPAGDRTCNEKAMLTHIYSNVKYPTSARDAGIEGKVIAQFVVGTDGAILEPQIIRSPDEAFSEEVLRLLREMPEWAPGRQAGEAVQVSFVLPVAFRLE